MNDFLEYQELYHHGILGQKWGVRRFQNADGSLTPKGQKRYNKVMNSNNMAYVYRNRKVLSDKDYQKKYESFKRDAEMKQMMRGDPSSIKYQMKVQAGRTAAKAAITAVAVTGTYLALTKTSAGKALVSKGKQAAKQAAINLVKEAGNASVNVAKNTANAAGEVAKTAAKSAAKTVTNTASNVVRKIPKGIRIKVV